MYFALFQDEHDNWLPFIHNDGRLRVWETLDSMGTSFHHRANVKVFSLDHTIKEQMIVSDKLAKSINMVDAVIKQAENLKVI